MENTANQSVTTEQAQKAQLQNQAPLFAPVMHTTELYSAIYFAKEKCKDEEHKLLIGEEATYLFRGPLKPNGEEIDSTYVFIADIEPCGEGRAHVTLAADLEGGLSSKFMTTRVLVHYLQVAPSSLNEESGLFMWSEESNDLVKKFLQRHSSR